MKTKIAIFLVSFCAVSLNALAAQPASKKTAKTTAAPRQLTIPKDAVHNPDGTYTYTDKQGRKWLYVNTPFGLSRSELKDSPADAVPSAAVTRAIDKGDMVRFERPSPFGTMSWEKKKAEL